jgi:Xaa-Pro aminopeptidase
MIADKKRKILADNICENSLLILSGNHEIIRNGDVYYSFRQSSDMLMLTGVSSPDIVLLGMKKNIKVEWIIYSDPISGHEKIWGTSRLDHAEIIEKSGVTDIRPMKDLQKDLKELVNNGGHIYTRDSSILHLKMGSKRGLALPKEKILSFDPILKPLRMIKLPEEIEKMREAIRITKIAHDFVRDSLKP